MSSDLVSNRDNQIDFVIILMIKDRVGPLPALLPSLIHAFGYFNGSDYGLFVHKLIILLQLLNDFIVAQ